MVDFRYHLVSIIAIFLALALGIVVGTTALNGVVVDGLRGSINALAAEKRGLEMSVGTLRSQTATDAQLAEQLGPRAVSGLLDGQRVLLVNAPNAPSGLSGALAPLLEQAGASVTGTVTLRPDLLDPAKAAVVDDVVARVAPAGLDLNGKGTVASAATELAAALLRPAGSGGGVSPAAAAEVLGGFQERDLVDADANLGARASLAVLLTGDPVLSADPAGPTSRTQGLLQVAAALDAAGRGAVVAGPLSGADPGGVLRALRDDAGLSARVSSVDGVDRPPGRIAAVYALREQAEGNAGRYGSGPGSQAALPALPSR